MRFLDLMAGSLRLINCLSQGEPIPGPEANEGLNTFNMMVDAWNTESLAVFSVQRQVFVPPSLKQVYTVGPNGDFAGLRPPRIEKYGILVNPGVQQIEYPVDSYTYDQWQSIPVKGVASTIPKVVWNDTGFPLMNLSYWPIPNTQINFVLYTWQQLAQLAALNTDISLPPAYLEAIKYNFAVRLGPEWGRADIPPVVMQIATESKGRLKALNMQPLTMRCDPALQSGRVGLYNYITDGRVAR